MSVVETNTAETLMTRQQLEGSEPHDGTTDAARIRAVVADATKHGYVLRLATGDVRRIDFWTAEDQLVLASFRYDPAEAVQIGLHSGAARTRAWARLVRVAEPDRPGLDAGEFAGPRELVDLFARSANQGATGVVVVANTPGGARALARVDGVDGSAWAVASSGEPLTLKAGRTAELWREFLSLVDSSSTD